jgi:phenylpyruvate tautomerase PptA (4-oxalocrotonate tautomerase family)
MPLVAIELLRGRNSSEKKAILDAVHDSLVAAFKIPDSDRVQRIVEHAREDFEFPPEHTERYTLITITCFAGRSLTAKRNLYREIVTRLERCDIPPRAVKIVLLEVPLDNWGLRGGHPASEIDLGFDIKV